MHSILAKPFYRPMALSLAIILTLSIQPKAVLASAQRTVTASAVIVPAQVTELSFIISAPVKEVTIQEGEHVQADQTLAVLDTPALNYEIAAAEAALRSEEANAKIQSYEKIRIFKHGKKRWVSVPHEVIDMANARVQQAQAAVEIAQINLAQGTLAAPHDGTIAALHVIPGEFAEQNQAVITLATLNNLQIETTDLSERDIPNVHIGDPVDISVEALQQEFTGNVIGISPMATTVGGDVVFKVTIAFDQQPGDLLWGMTAEVNIGE